MATLTLVLLEGWVGAPHGHQHQEEEERPQQLDGQLHLKGHRSWRGPLALRGHHGDPLPELQALLTRCRRR